MDNLKQKNKKTLITRRQLLILRDNLYLALKSIIKDEIGFSDALKTTINYIDEILEDNSNKIRKNKK